MPQSSYQLLKDTYEAIGRLEAKMDERICNLEKRTGILESFMGKVLTIAAIAGSISGVVITWFWDKITGKA